MPEPFKNLLNPILVQEIAKHFKRNWQDFNEDDFVKDICQDLESLELKARTDHITNHMISYLPPNFEKSAKIILKSLGTELEEDLSAGLIDSRGIAGWAIMPLAQYVALQGQDHFAISMNLFKELTKRASAEFAIRHFLLAFPEKTLSVLKNWATDENQHVRRLASEGSRPRLPWGMQLTMYTKDPSPLLSLLEQLKDDEKEYVRRSVANSLNDIAKDHPDLVANIAEKWMLGANTNRQRLAKHACRTLLKQGHTQTLKVFGYNSPQIEKVGLQIEAPLVTFGKPLEFTLSIQSSSTKKQSLMIDYIIHHQKANGKTSPKVFKWKSTSLVPPKTLHVSKKHPFKKITTRVYYPGIHTLEIIINGTSVANADFELLIP